MTSLIISIDIGTTSTKSTIFTTTGHALASFYQGYPMTKDGGGRATQDPESIFQGVLTTLKNALDFNNTREKLIAVTFSSAMHSLIGLDGNHQPLTPVITWADSRANQWAEQLKNSPQGPTFYQKTGTPLHPMTPLSKIMWLKQEESDLYHQIKLFTSIKEYILYRLFNTHLVDYSIASGTGLFNIHSLTWDQDILSFLELSEERLPKAVPPTTQLTKINKAYQKQLGLPDNIPFVIGASDGALANLGTNCISSEKANLSIGTSAALRYTVRSPLLHQTGETFCYLLDEGYWVIGGAANNGGMIIDWARQLTANDMSYDDFMAKVEKIPAGSDNLFFHPYLSGERAPIWSGDIRGSFTGLALSHTDAHLMRAILEGICFNIADIFQALNSLTAQPIKICASGGFSHSPTWKQMMADILGQPITFPKTHESSGLGAMILALKSLGLIANYEESNHLAVFQDHSTEELLMPIKTNQQLYVKQLIKYQQLKELTKLQTTILTD
ncbi:gluconokinase [Vagococcus sp. BWB3-3]|uniref:Gluconokinase n=1 Tax=Vagococcus allomyrinae TaxID=2794353 RepID=A0A940PCD7_9ENTE|nr:gluconokinase [Vagococcus allomyrinae]MBP1041957.1 gluconokinase [Vagococcus allomyrinae]